MDLAGLEQEHLPRRAAVQFPAAVELLDALLGEADQVAFVKVRVVGVAFEMGTDRLDAGLGILLQIDPVMRTHGGSGNARRAWEGKAYSTSFSTKASGDSGIFVQRPGAGRWCLGC